MIFSSLWGRVTGKDKGKQFPEQQASALGRLGDYAIIFPYGLYCDVPIDSLLFIPGKGKACPVTVDRPDAAQGEVVLFHPVTGAKITMKNGGDIDVDAGSGNVNILGGQINLGEGGAAIARVGDSVQVTVVGGSSAGTHNGTITSGGGNTST